MLESAANHWTATVTRLISHRENAVYEVSLPNGDRAALRQHRIGYQTPASIGDELAWTNALADAGFPCPRPLPTASGDFLVQLGDAAFSCVTWVDAPPIAEQQMTPTQLEVTFYALGKLLAQLHNLTTAHALTAPNRPAWSCDGLTGSDPLWGKYWETATTEDDADALIAARDIGRAWLNSKPFEQGLIHADALGENVLGTPDDLWLIDFDDSGHGYLGYDLGVALTQHWEAPYLTALADALLDGYSQNRPTDLTRDDLLRFMALRCLASAGWVQGRMLTADPRHGQYVRRAVLCSQIFRG